MDYPKISGSADFRTCSREQKDFYRKEFLETNDPTGYLFAEKWVEDGYRKWADMQSAFGIKAELKEWRDTLEIKLQALGIISIAQQKDSFQAAKWLADKGWSEKEDKRTKEHKKRAQELHDHVKSDMARIGFKVA